MGSKLGNSTLDKSAAHGQSWSKLRFQSEAHGGKRSAGHWGYGSYNQNSRVYDLSRKGE